MVQLVGTVELAAGLRISAPGVSGEVELVRAAAGAGRTGGAVPAGCLTFAPLEAALVRRCADVRTVELAPSAVRPARPRVVGAGEAFIRLDVSPPGGQGALVVVQHETGELAWHAPVPTVAGDALTFRVPVPAAHAALLGEGGWQKKVFKVAFFDLADVALGRAGAFLVGRWEEESRPTRLRWFRPEHYDLPCSSSDLITRQDLAALGGRRVLLFLHGALGTSYGAFGGISRREMARLWAAYDGRVLAFDHPTLADSPRRTAERLVGLFPDTLDASLDVMCHGRGALVARVLAGELGPPPAGIRVRRIIPAGAPDHGPLPADVRQLTALLDDVTNALAALPARGLQGEILGGLVDAAKLVAGCVAPCPDPLPTDPAGSRQPALAGVPA